jgi:hypothetical protein
MPNNKLDGLAQSWQGRIFFNPPYSRGEIDKFVEKLLKETNVQDASVLLVVGPEPEERD